MDHFKIKRIKTIKRGSKPSKRQNQELQEAIKTRPRAREQEVKSKNPRASRPNQDSGADFEAVEVRARFRARISGRQGALQGE